MARSDRTLSPTRIWAQSSIRLWPISDRNSVDVDDVEVGVGWALCVAHELRGVPPAAMLAIKISADVGQISIGLWLIPMMPNSRAR